MRSVRKLYSVPHVAQRYFSGPRCILQISCVHRLTGCTQTAITTSLNAFVTNAQNDLDY